MKVTKVATVVGPKDSGAVAAAPSLTVDAPPTTVSAEASAAATAAAASTQPKVQKYNKKFWTHQKYNKSFWTRQKYKRPHQKYNFVFATEVAGVAGGSLLYHGVGLGVAHGDDADVNGLVDDSRLANVRLFFCGRNFVAETRAAGSTARNAYRTNPANAPPQQHIFLQGIALEN
jgi:hypothetical protein